MATIRRVPTVEHNFQLVVTKVYDEGDQELLEDEDESELQSILFQLFSFCFFQHQRTRKGLFSSAKNLNSEQVTLMMNHLSFGATSMAISTSRSNL